MEKLTTAQVRALRRRYHVWSEIGLVFLDLSADAHNVLILLKFMQGTREESPIPDLAVQRTLYINESRFWDAMDELESKGALVYGFPDEDDECGTFSILPVEIPLDVLRILTGKNEIELPAELCR